MSKQDDYKFEFELRINTLHSNKSGLFEALSVNNVIDNRVKASVRRGQKSLFIAVKAKDINVLRSVINGYTNTLKMLEEIDGYE